MWTWGYLRINVAIGAVPADVELVLCGFLVHRIIEVDGVGVFQPPVSPRQYCSKHHQSHDHCEQRQASGHSLDSGRRVKVRDA